MLQQLSVLPSNPCFAAENFLDKNLLLLLFILNLSFTCKQRLIVNQFTILKGKQINLRERDLETTYLPKLAVLMQGFQQLSWGMWSSNLNHSLSTVVQLKKTLIEKEVKTSPRFLPRAVAGSLEHWQKYSLDFILVHKSSLRPSWRSARSLVSS